MHSFEMDVHILFIRFEVYELSGNTNRCSYCICIKIIIYLLTIITVHIVNFVLLLCVLPTVRQLHKFYIDSDY